MFKDVWARQVDEPAENWEADAMNWWNTSL